METLVLDGFSLDLDSISQVARADRKATLDPDAVLRMDASRAVVDRCVREKLVRYGITTGFGKFCDVAITGGENVLLQKNLIMSHACGQGNPLPPDVVRAMMLLRANALAVGNSGIRPSTVRTLLAMLNANLIPVVPEKGSLGSSGDLAPLAHMVLPMIGLGEAYLRGERMSGADAMKSAGIVPVVLEAKEGLALINGTQAMTAIAALAAYDALNLLKTADLAASLSLQALRGIRDAFDPRVHELRRQSGQIACAERMRRLLENSAFVTRQGELRVQDPYVLRCVPQVHGASVDAIGYVRSIVDRELNAVTDNPLIFPAATQDAAELGDIISGGNFHGQPVALAMDFLAIACAELADISERRIERLVNPALSNGLPAFLTPSGGLNSGFMIVQYSAASLVSENKVLAHPASVDSIPSSANQEDHVSMGTIAARKAASIIGNVQSVLAMELTAACQALDLRTAQMGDIRAASARHGGVYPATVYPDDAPDAPAAALLSPATREAYLLIRSAVLPLSSDRVMYPDLDAVRALVASGAIAAACA